MGYAGNQWTFGSSKDVIIDNLLTWSNQDRLDSGSDPISEEDCCKDFEK